MYNKWHFMFFMLANDFDLVDKSIIIFVIN